MTITYTMDENAFLAHQLYVASKSDRIRTKRQRSRAIVPILYSIFGIFLYLYNRNILAIGFIVFGIVWYFIYPIWEKRRYVKHYRDFIRDNYNDRLGKTATLEITNDFILAKDNGSVSKVLTSEIKDICDLPQVILIRLRGGQSFIIPKNSLSDIVSVTDHLKFLAVNLNILYSNENQWKWS